MMKRNAFTLAEVLTTLMVIGVVAAMTIPALINSTDDQQNRVAFKKAMSVLGQAIQLNVAKEVDECFVTNAGECEDGTDEGFATWINNSLSGTRNGNTITTPDGMTYTFFVDGADSISECGTEAPTYSGAGDVTALSCGVMVDVNGTGKGTRALPAAMAASNAVTDQYPLIITSVGVYPFANNGYSRAWQAMYGENAAAPNDVAFE
ncbi:MAG: type II secretion system protein [Candidatus Gastranaerophilales bacterium]|nr:type II secretion system protein [Candidatus Gastranaerophilales bacterium]